MWRGRASRGQLCARWPGLLAAETSATLLSVACRPGQPAPGPATSGPGAAATQIPTKPGGAATPAEVPQ